MVLKYAYTSSKVREESIKFRIPLYQRPYAWEDEQVLQLLNDLYNAYLDCQNNLVSDYNNPDCDYHIGILSVAQTVDDKNCYDLIDGQQRITTLMLIAKAARAVLKDCCPYWNEFLTAKRLDLYGRDKDQQFMESSKVDDVNVECNDNMKKAVENAMKFIKARGADFSKYIYHHAAFFLSEAPPGYSLMDKNQQFVRMNNRGKQLEMHEILKVRLISKITTNTDARDKSFTTWGEMLVILTGMRGDDSQELLKLEDILKPGKDENKLESREEILRSAIVTVPEFLLIALSRYCTKNGKDEVAFDTDKLLERFEILLSDKDEVNVIDFITNYLAKQVYYLQSYFIFIDKDGEYDFHKDSSKFENSTDNDRLNKVQSFLYVSTRPHFWLIPAFNWCNRREDERQQIYAGDFIKELERIDNELIHNQKRDLSPISTMIELEDPNKMMYGDVKYYWFYRLDYELWKLWDCKVDSPEDDIWSAFRDNKGETWKLLQKFRFRRCNSVEHIIPQTPEVKKDIETPTDHSFGNLALISRSQNSRLNNYNPAGKKTFILASGYTESLKMLHFLWGSQNAKLEGKKMHSILLNAVKKGDLLLMGQKDGSDSFISTSFTGKGVIVGLLDTGIDLNKSGFRKDQCIAWKDYIEDRQGPYDWENTINPEKSFHGTGMAKILCGNAPDIQLVVCRLPPDNFDDISHYSPKDLIDAIALCIDNGVKVISMSLSNKQFDVGVEAAINDAVHNHGITFVTSAGNKGNEQICVEHPAQNGNVITVGAVDENNMVEDYSSRGTADHSSRKPNICALGHFDGSDGTSNSCPIVAATCARMLEANPELSPMDIMNILQETATPIDQPVPNNDSGFGLLNAEKAIEAAIHRQTALQ